MDITIATVTIAGIAPYSQSHQHDEPALPGERPDAYDARTWRSHLNVDARPDGSKTVVIPAHAVQQGLASAARYSKLQIPGLGKSTWTAKFTSGIAVLQNPELNINPDTVDSVLISANADGVRGSGKRVPRRFPVMLPWESSFQVYVLDPIINETVFHEILAICGMFIGFGRFRPEKGGTNGRFAIKDVKWASNMALDLVA